MKFYVHKCNQIDNKDDVTVCSQNLCSSVEANMRAMPDMQSSVHSIRLL